MTQVFRDRDSVRECQKTFGDRLDVQTIVVMSDDVIFHHVIQAAMLRGMHEEDPEQMAKFPLEFQVAVLYDNQYMDRWNQPVVGGRAIRPYAVRATHSHVCWPIIDPARMSIRLSGELRSSVLGCFYVCSKQDALCALQSGIRFDKRMMCGMWPPFAASSEMLLYAEACLQPQEDWAVIQLSLEGEFGCWMNLNLSNGTLWTDEDVDPSMIVAMWFADVSSLSRGKREYLMVYSKAADGIEYLLNQVEKLSQDEVVDEMIKAGVENMQRFAHYDGMADAKAKAAEEFESDPEGTLRVLQERPIASAEWTWGSGILSTVRCPICLRSTLRGMDRCLVCRRDLWALESAEHDEVVPWSFLHTGEASTSVPLCLLDKRLIMRQSRVRCLRAMRKTTKVECVDDEPLMLIDVLIKSVTHSARFWKKWLEDHETDQRMKFFKDQGPWGIGEGTVEPG